MLSPDVFSNITVLIYCMSYVQDLVRFMCGIKSVYYVQALACVILGFSLSYMCAVVCAMCGLTSVLCAACSHEPRRLAPSMPRFAW